MPSSKSGKADFFFHSPSCHYYEGYVCLTKRDLWRVFKVSSHISCGGGSAWRGVKRAASGDSFQKGKRLAFFINHYYSLGCTEKTSEENQF
jgi:hypothetical protein